MRQEESAEWVKYDQIPKEDYKLVENAISLIFNGSFLFDGRFWLGHRVHRVHARLGSQLLLSTTKKRFCTNRLKKPAAALGSATILSTAGMPGKIVKIFVNKGDIVKGQSTDPNHGSHEDGKRDARGRTM